MNGRVQMSTESWRHIGKSRKKGRQITEVMQKTSLSKLLLRWCALFATTCAAGIFFGSHRIAGFG
jgi:hypothetical protein